MEILVKCAAAFGKIDLYNALGVGVAQQSTHFLDPKWIGRVYHEAVREICSFIWGTDNFGFGSD